ncbi:MAG: FlgD immunoglobulin-like domain containing protein, partial [Candidatus Krumholzibacteria bacterium]|nr:FlgD immunoglobulin-like domain containing protein [Candidatus Krumholzibacteria bacterium]
DIPFVKIELSRDNGETWEILAQSTENIGTWPWLVEGSPSADCLAKISSSDGSVSGESNAPFLIFQPLDWIELEVSEGGLGAGETANIPVNLDASGLAQGDYRVNIVIEHNAPGPDITVPLILHVLEGGTGVEFETPELQHFGNFPNPFNPKTRLDFHLPTSGPALLQIHDVSGRVLRTLHEGVLASGFHSLEWDGRDHFGQELPSGIYFSRLSFGNESRSRKMLLLK